MKSSVERRLAAILAADVAGYSRLMGVDETGTAQAIREHHAAADRPSLPPLTCLSLAHARNPAPCGHRGFARLRGRAGHPPMMIVSRRSMCRSSATPVP
jgi:hypothetical protein